MSKNKVVIGIVDSEGEAENLLQRLRQDGFSSSEISAIFPDKRGTRDFAHEALRDCDTNSKYEISINLQALAGRLGWRRSCVRRRGPSFFRLEWLIHRHWSISTGEVRLSGAL